VSVLGDEAFRLCGSNQRREIRWGMVTWRIIAGDSVVSSGQAATLGKDRGIPPSGNVSGM